MKVYLILTLGWFSLSVINAQSSFAAEPLKLRSSTGEKVLASQSLLSDAIYPGCGKSIDGFEVSTCFTNLISNAITENLKGYDIQSECGKEPLTLKLKIDEKGKISLDSIEGKELTSKDIKAFTDAVSKINRQIQESNQSIVPAIDRNGEPTKVYKNIPYVLEGKGYYNFDNFQVNGIPYKVFRNCQNFYIKKGDNDSTVDIIKGEAQYQQFKNELTSSSDAQLSQNAPVTSEK